MKFSHEQWKLIAAAVRYVGAFAGEHRMAPIQEMLGPQGMGAAVEGVEPADDEPSLGEMPEEIDLADRVDEHLAELIIEHENLYWILVEMGTRLVEECGYEPASVSLHAVKDQQFFKSTQAIGVFIAWLCRSPEARRMLEDYGFEWRKPGAWREALPHDKGSA